MLKKSAPALTTAHRRGILTLLILSVFVAGWQIRKHISRAVVVPPVVAECPALLEINGADSAALEALPGIGPVLAQRILKFRKSLCGFTDIAELKQVYGLKPEVFSKISEQIYVKPADRSQCEHRFAKGGARQQPSEIVSPEAGPATPPLPAPAEAGTPRYNKPQNPKVYAVVDLNAADSLTLLGVPGIGEKTAGRIVRFRNRIGFFANVAQIQEVYGISEENFNLMKEHLSASPVTGKMIAVNAATKDQMGNHPYIGWTNARILTAYHEQHGDFTSVEALRDVNGLDWARLEKAIPYLTF